MRHLFRTALLSVAASCAITHSLTASAQPVLPVVSPDGLGDMAIIPYYSVQGDFQTGVHIINTSDRTQVIKLRFRRASDSMDALDLNLVMSPRDVWTGSISDDSGELLLSTDDTTCTVPENSAGKPPGVFAFPDLYRVGAEEGYIEVIAMGTPEDSFLVSETPGGDPVLDPAGSGEDTAIAQAAVHVNGVPRSCDQVRDNFFSRNPTVLASNGQVVPDEWIGNWNFAQAAQEWWEDLDDLGDSGESQTQLNEFADSGNVLRVSYFLRDATSGLEFGSEAVHLHDFLTVPSMTNQQFGLFSGDITGFDYPDLNGGVPEYDMNTTEVVDNALPQLASEFTADRLRIFRLRQILGVETILNDWSTASERNVSTDWVVTFPGQYTMLDYYLYTLGEVAGFFECGEENPADENEIIPECDFRDLPIRAEFSNAGGVYDREEGQLDPEEGELVVSPSIPGQVATTLFEHEVNVIEWSNGQNDPVLGSEYTVTVDTSQYALPFGWAELSVSSGNTTVDDTDIRLAVQPGAAPSGISAPAICFFQEGIGAPDGDVTPPNGAQLGFIDDIPLMACGQVTNGIPMVGFIAWERSFPADPSANYGRIIPHGSTAPPPPP